jgi:hypothetical protein
MTTASQDGRTRRRAHPFLRTGNLFGLLLLAASLRIRADESAAAVVSLSDGSVLSGQVRLIGARPLTLVPLGEDRQRTFLFRDIVSVDHAVETNSLERPWVFKESGKAEKVYLDGTYPLMNFVTRVALVSGNTVTGHVISAALTLAENGHKRKVFLQRQIKGEIGQTLADMVYVCSVRMTDHAPVGGTPIAGSVEGFGRLESVSALDCVRGDVLFARVTPDNRFDFGALLPGRYDLCALTDTHVLIGLSDAVPPAAEASAPLRTEDLAAIEKKFPLADDFFNDRWILRLGGNRGFAKALVYQRRGAYHEAEKWTPGGFLWHLEVWGWHFADPDWKLDRHYILIRHKQNGAEQNRKLLIGTPLAAVSPGTVCAIRAGEDTHGTWTPLRDLN